MITCKIDRILFENEDTGFSICKALIVDGANELPENVITENDAIVIKGYFPKSKVIRLKVDGDWVYTKFGYQLNVTSFTEDIPQTEEGIIAYLCSFVYGLKETTAKKIVDQFGLNTIKVFEESPEKLLDVRGIGRQKLKKIIDSFTANRAIQDIVTFLAPFGVTANKCVKIAKEFGGESMSIITNEPFRLCDIDGFGFITVDEIARKTTFELKDPLRIRGALKYVLQSSANEGHLCLKQQEAIISAYLLLNEVDYKKDKISKSIGYFMKSQNFHEISQHITNEIVPISLVVDEFKRMAFDSTIKGDNSYVYLSSEYEQENDIANIIVNRLKCNVKSYPESEIRKEIAKQEKMLNIKLAAKQVEAVILGVNNNTCIITGGPGTGKTTVLRLVLNVCEKFSNINPTDVTLLAPTGRAAQRMCEAVGSDYTASTIHSCLKISEDGHGAFESIYSKIVVVDEASMVDNYIGWCLLNAVPTDSKLIIIGDAEQLPSVGAGNVLFEFLTCKQIPTVRLDVIYRQSGTSSVVINSDLIKENITNLKYDENFQFISVRENKDFPKNDKERSNKIQQEAADIVVEQFLKAVSEKSLDEVQVLCPMRKEGIVAGATELNKVIQEKINPSNPQKAEIKKGKTIYRVGDKVILTKNNYDLMWEDGNGQHGEGMFNGDVGYITKIDKADDKVYIDFCGKKVCFDITQMSDVELAYAISIHKSQGSEYQTVIIPILSAFSIMLKRNLIYTGITRAKKKVILVGHQKALTQAITTNVIAKRNTQLGRRIKEKRELTNVPEQIKLL